MSNYIVIGDIHGQAGKLEQLLLRLGFTEVAGVYTPPVSSSSDRVDTRLVFLGDFIDRGPDNRRVIEIVRNMMAQGYAQAVMGNHEFNAICYHTPHPDTGLPLRSHCGKNQAQHASFLAEYALNAQATREVIEWFMSLPLFLKLDTQPEDRVEDSRATSVEPQCDCLRAVHACWDKVDVDYLAERLGEPAVMDQCFLLEAACEGSRAFAAIETLLKGPEIPLPAGSSFFDKDGYERTHIRYKWWADGETYREVAMLTNDQLSTIPDVPLSGSYHPIPYPVESPPIFFGHYWLNGEPRLLSQNAVCLDYSAGKGGALVAYQWYESDSKRSLCRLRNDRFITAN